MFSRSLRNGTAALAAGLALAGPAAAASAERLVIPRLALDVPTARTLELGPMVYYRDADTVAIAGHRTTRTRPFLNLPRLRRGHVIRLGEVKYHVTRTAIVRPWHTWVLRYEGLVLSACHPAGSSAYRFVVFARRADPPDSS